MNQRNLVSTTNFPEKDDSNYRKAFKLHIYCLQYLSLLILSAVSELKTDA